MQIQKIELSETLRCNSDSCGWAGHVSQAVSMDFVQPLCPQCHETTEPVSCGFSKTDIDNRVVSKELSE